MKQADYKNTMILIGALGSVILDAPSLRSWRKGFGHTLKLPTRLPFQSRQQPTIDSKITSRRHLPVGGVTTTHSSTLDLLRGLILSSPCPPAKGNKLSYCHILFKCFDTSLWIPRHVLNILAEGA